MSSRLLAGISILIVIFILVSRFFDNQTSWLIMAGLMVAFAAVIGKTINGRWTGILIDERNKMSLSRFQIVIWTLIIVSAYFAIASARISAGVADPLAIGIQWQLWALLGISATSLVGTPLIIDDKKKKEVKAYEDTLFQDPNRVGIVATNPNVSDAEFANIFKGEEVGNRDQVDISKVQMFFFTIISALSYVVTLFYMLDTIDVPPSLPVLPDGLIALLTISHGAYLTNKTVDHTPTE